MRIECSIIDNGSTGRLVAVHPDTGGMPGNSGSADPLPVLRHRRIGEIHAIIPQFRLTTKMQPVGKPRKNWYIALLHRGRIADDLATKARLESIQSSPVVAFGAGNLVETVGLGGLGGFRRNAPEVVVRAAFLPSPRHRFELQGERGAMRPVPG